MPKKTLTGILINSIGKSIERAAKSANREKRREEVKQQKSQETYILKKEKEIRELNFKNELIRKGYTIVSIKSLYKYSPIINIREFVDIQKQLMIGKTKIAIFQTDLNIWDAKLKLHKEEEKLLAKCASLNNKGIEYEKQGKIKLAIKTYEKNIELGYQATHSYDRLMILYHKKKDYDNELRIIEEAINNLCKRYPDLHDKYLVRKEKVESLIDRLSK